MDAIIKFDPAKEDLVKIAEDYRKIVVVDKETYKQSSEARKKLKATRVTIKKMGKSMRDDANNYAKKVIAEEKWYIELIEPTERYLEQQEKDFLEKLEIESRREELPQRRKMLDDIKYTEIEDNDILKLSAADFAQFYMNKKIEFDQNEELRKDEEAEKKAAQEKIEQDKKDAAEKAKKDAEEKAEREKKELQEKAEKEKQDAIKKVEEDKKAALEKAEKEKADALAKSEKEKQDIIDKQNKEKAEKEAEEKRKKEEKEKAEKNEKYQAFLTVNDHNPDTDKIERVGDEFILFRQVARITIK